MQNKIRYVIIFWYILLQDMLYEPETSIILLYRLSKGEEDRVSRNRYVGDYHLADSLDERGKIRTEVEYVGGLYSFLQSEEIVRRAKRHFFCLCAAGWLAYIAALIPVSAATRAFYSAVPFVFIAVPLGLLTATAVEIYPLKERFIHRYADRMDNRYPAGAAFVMILSAVSLAGEMVNIIRGLELRRGDWLFSGCALLLFLTGRLFFRNGKKLKCGKVS